jgi:hypothetical protein
MLDWIEIPLGFKMTVEKCELNSGNAGMHQDIYPTKNSQGKWNKIFDSGHSKDWRSDSYDRFGG